MDIKDYLETYKYPIGQKVKIKECHSRPELVDKLGKVAGWVDAEILNYPLMVFLDEPIFIPVAPGVPLAVPFQGPHFCRPEELEPISDIPDMFLQAFENKGDNSKEDSGG